MAKTETPRGRLVASTRYDAEEELWEEIKNSKDPEGFKDYLEAYPNGRFKVTARIKKRKLERNLGKTPAAKPAPQTAAVKPPAPAKEGPPRGVTWERVFGDGNSMAHSVVPVPGGGYGIAYSTPGQGNERWYTSLLRVNRREARLCTR